MNSRKLTVQPQFTLDDVYITVFTERRVINADGSESLTDSHTEGDTLIVHETAAKFVLRSGKSVLGIDNRSYDGTGTFNRTGTDDKESVRLLK